MKLASLLDNKRKRVLIAKLRGWKAPLGYGFYKYSHSVINSHSLCHAHESETLNLMNIAYPTCADDQGVSVVGSNYRWSLTGCISSDQCYRCT